MELQHTIVVLGGLLICQLAIGVLMVSFANTVVCKDTSFWSTARLLRPLVQCMEDTGSAVTGDKIARLFKNKNLRYGVRTDGMGGKHLEILMECPEKAPGRSERRYMKSGSFPEGY